MKDVDGHHGDCSRPYVSIRSKMLIVDFAALIQSPDVVANTTQKFLRMRSAHRCGNFHVYQPKPLRHLRTQRPRDNTTRQSAPRDSAHTLSRHTASQTMIT